MTCFKLKSKICLKAIEYSSDYNSILQYVKDQTFEICMKAVLKSDQSFRFINDKKIAEEVLLLSKV